MEKKCTQCGEEKSVNEFYKNGNRKQSFCKKCYCIKSKELYNEKIESVREYKETYGCIKCGEKRGHVLDFHHKDPSEKDFGISHRTRAGLKTLMNEIAKCILLCSNCHRDVHYLMMSDNRFDLEEYLISRTHVA